MDHTSYVLYIVSNQNFYSNIIIIITSFTNVDVFNLTAIFLFILVILHSRSLVCYNNVKLIRLTVC